MADAKGDYIGGVPVQFKDAAARAMISDEYNSAETYAKGNLCIYNGKIYEAIKETTGTWDATAWEETTLAKVNGKLNGDITNLTEKELEKSLFQKKTITSATPGWVATGMPIKNTIILSADVISTPDGKTNYTCVKTYNKDSYTINLQIKDGDYNTPSAEGEYKIEIRYLDLTL